MESIAGARRSNGGVFWPTLVALYLFCWYMQLGYRIDFLATIRFELLLGAVLGLKAIIVLMQERAQSHGLTKPVFAWFTILIIYTIFSFSPEYSKNIFVDRVLKFSMTALFLKAFIKDGASLKIILSGFILAILKLGQEGFVGWLFGGLVWENQGIMRLHGSIPNYQHPNSFSGLAVSCLPFAFYLFPLAVVKEKLLLIVLGCFLLTIILFTGSRTGYVGALFFLVLFFSETIKRYWFRGSLSAILCVVLIASFAPDQYVGRFESIFTGNEAEGASTSARMQIIHDAVEVYFAYPFGVGVAAFPAVRQEMFGRVQDTHNLYLELLTNLSPIGVLIFLWFIFKMISVNKGIMKDVRAKPINIALSKIVISYLYLRLVLGVFGMDAYEVWWWFALGLTFGNLNLLASEND
ncbi:O-antigen ligase family protein [Simiduia litorea]|uniref:O-antigen ligase family protein n=1 Tax=Simiduia litorea TaxID=1435348 RepID=UPI0036F277C7